MEYKYMHRLTLTLPFCTNTIRTALLLGLLFLPFNQVQAQIKELLFEREHRINPEKKGELLFELDNLSFFKNNEFEGYYQKGYTLPGIWIQPKLIFYPLRNMKLELGAHLLWYWGASNYPSAPYIGIPTWIDEEKSDKRAHALPFFRFQVELYKNVNVVLGNIYGGSNHQLVLPLYNPEYNLTSDPESGLQLLFDYRRFFLDAWVDWQSFIFNGDNHQEMFTAGVSSKIKCRRPEAGFQVNVPLQAVFHHRGGEIDNVDSTIKTWFNAATGVELSYLLSQKFIRKIDLSLIGTYSAQQSGTVLPVDKGYGFNAQLSAEAKDFKLSAGYWKCKDFFTISGSPFFGSISISKESKTYDKPSMAYATFEYTRRFGKSYALGADLSVFHQFSSPSKEFVSSPDGTSTTLFTREKAATSITIGVYLRINPSILIKKF